MTKPKKLAYPVDVWGRLHSIFEGSSEELPEIYFDNMTGDQLAACLIYLMNYCREVNSRFKLTGTNVTVDAASPEAAIRAIVRGEISAAIMMDFPGIPAIIVYVREADSMALSYVRGQWTAQSAIALFDLMHQLVTIAPNAEVVPDYYDFTPEEQSTFMEVWREFHNATL
jgi:hypothetical protein